jgi:hypothetical protein
VRSRRVRLSTQATHTKIAPLRRKVTHHRPVHGNCHPTGHQEKLVEHYQSNDPEPIAVGLSAKQAENMGEWTRRRRGLRVIRGGLA